MPHVALGILIMLAGATIMACGLYVHTTGPRHSPTGRTLANLVVTVVLLLLGLAVAVAGIIVSLEPNTTK